MSRHQFALTVNGLNQLFLDFLHAILDNDTLVVLVHRLTKDVVAANLIVVVNVDVLDTGDDFIN